MKDLIETSTGEVLVFRKPEAGDGSAVWALVEACAPLDRNSMYCNLIQCDHFADTCMLAEMDGAPVGWVSGHLVPDAIDTLFVWQVAVAKVARGQGLASAMLDRLLLRAELAGVRRLQTTITQENLASWRLFRGLAERKAGVLSDKPHFAKDSHFGGKHATEHLVTILLPGPAVRAA